MKICPVCKKDIIINKSGDCQCVCGYSEFTAKKIDCKNPEINEKSKEIDVPLTWEEIDKIVLALRLTNNVFNGKMRDDLEEKMTNYSEKAKNI